MPDSGRTARTIVWAIVVLFVTTMGAVVAMVLLGDSGQSATLVATVLPQLGAIAAVLVNLRATAQVDTIARKVARDTHALTNGLLDSKVRAGVAEVVHDAALDPAYVAEQLEADERTRASTRERPTP